jgi:menaquinone-specific isochorismate synthase
VTAAPYLTPAKVRAVRTVPIPSPGTLGDLRPERGGLAWVTGGDGLVGWGEVARLDVRGPDRFARADAWWRDLLAGAHVTDEVGLPGCGPVVFGSFAFDGETGTSVLIVPEVVVGTRDGRSWLTTVGTAAGALGPRPAARAPGVVGWSQGALSDARWMGAVGEAIDRIGAGEVEKVVLARDVLAHTADPLDPRWPLGRLASTYPSCWTFAVDGLLGSTPEMLLRLDRDRAASRVLAGTLRRSGDPAKDLRKGSAFAGSVKDLEEHGYGVRSVADALAPHCAVVDVPAAPFVLQLPNVMHLATDVTARVTDGSTSLGLLASLHPSAAVCGSPTRAALQVIRDVEAMDRGRYAGPVGWMDSAGDGEWGIALRCAQVEAPDRLRLFAGCGIVAGSRPDDELAESNAKLVPMRHALGSASPVP